LAPSVQTIFNSFVRLTRDELWESEEELRAYVCAENNYEKLLKEEIGINLIHTHSAMSLAVMDDRVNYVFQTANVMLSDSINSDTEMSAMFNDIQAFCGARAHNIWGSDRNEDNPCISLRYDIAGWMRSPLTTPLTHFNLSSPVTYQFGFSDAKKEEMAPLIQRYGITKTGIGRIIIQMGRSRIWREPVTLRCQNEFQSKAHAG